MRKLILFFATCICIISCTTKQKSEQTKECYTAETIEVDLSKEYTGGRKFPHTNYSMTVQRLQESEENPVGQVDKLIVDKKRIYILDRSKARAIFVYNREGSLLHIIDYTGNGPGEFSFPQDFEVDSKTGNIMVMDAGSKKIISYSSKGEYIKEIKYDFFAIGFIMDNENNFIFDLGNVPSESSSFYLKKTDQNGNLLSTYFPSNPSTVGMTFNPRSPFQKYKETFFYHPTMSNNIYALDGEDSKLAYQLDFGKYWPSEEFCESVKNMHPLKMRELIFEKGYVCFLNCIQTKDVLHVDFFKEKRYSFYYNKKTKQSLLLDMEDDSLSYPLAVYNDEFIFIKYNEETGEPIVVFYTVDFNL